MNVFRPLRNYMIPLNTVFPKSLPIQKLQTLHPSVKYITEQPIFLSLNFQQNGTSVQIQIHPKMNEMAERPFF